MSSKANMSSVAAQPIDLYAAVNTICCCYSLPKKIVIHIFESTVFFWNLYAFLFIFFTYYFQNKL